MSKHEFYYIITTRFISLVRKHRVFVNRAVLSNGTLFSNKSGSIKERTQMIGNYIV